jgi:drug/metabolite transporter (DMT)-like permease
LRIIFSIGFFMMLPFCWTEFNSIPWEIYTAKTFSILAVVVLGGTFLAYLFNIYGIKILGASVSGSYIYLQPLFAAAIAISFLNEHLSNYKIIAGALIFTGVFLANKQPTNANNNSK